MLQVWSSRHLEHQGYGTQHDLQSKPIPVLRRLQLNAVGGPGARASAVSCSMQSCKALAVRHEGGLRHATPGSSHVQLQTRRQSP